jgi:ornithine cyclodeaminase/alanine dehydrogenase-like protein (mu-crystallin family)
MWVFTNEDVEKMITMRECMAVLEELYRDLGNGQALFMPRVDNIMPCSHEDAYYGFKHMGGGWPRRRIMALRINSDVITHPSVGGAVRRVKVPKAAGRWVGLVQLYSSETGELLAIFPDGVAQRMRVGATNGLGVRYLARKDARRVGIIGSGWQAGTQLQALLEERHIEEIRVFSPTRKNRESFTEEMRRLTGANIIPAESPDECVQDADIIMAATSSLVPVIKAEWLREGVHVSCIKIQEVDGAVIDRCQRVFTHTSLQRTHARADNVLPGTLNMPMEHKHGWWNEEGREQKNFPDISDLATGKEPGRIDHREITCFVNNVGIGLQFAAVGALILEKARGLGLGTELPAEWFSETVHP